MNLFTFIVDVISLFYLLSFLFSFIPLQFSKLKTAFMLVLCFCTIVSCDFMIYKGIINVHLIMFITFFEAVITQLTAVCISSLKTFQSLFIGISASCYVLVGNVIGAAIYVMTDQIWLSVMIIILVHSLVLCALYKFLKKRILLINLVKEKMWKYLCIIPVLFYLTEYSLNIWPGNIFKNPSNALTAVFLLLLLAGAYIIVVVLLRTQRREGDLKHSNELLVNYADSMKHEAELLKKSEDSMRIYRHDMRHKMRAIAGYIAQDQKEEAIRVIEKNVEELDILTPTRFCRNIVINGILDQWSKEAKLNQIQFNLNVDMPEHLKMEEFKLAVILSNLIENAQQAAIELPKEQRWVNLNIRPTKGRLIIEISNSYNKASITSADFSEIGLPISKKGEGHGFGLKSVYTFVQMNKGTMDCSCEHGVFYIRILIQDVAEVGTELYQN